jgi:hypothetical protein
MGSNGAGLWIVPKVMTWQCAEHLQDQVLGILPDPDDEPVLVTAAAEKLSVMETVDISAIEPSERTSRILTVFWPWFLRHHPNL